MSAIFISHNSEDAAASKRLTDALRDKGFRSLFYSTTDVAGGEEWEPKLYHRLKASRALVWVASPASVESSWVHTEISQARAIDVVVIPFVVEPFERNDHKLSRLLSGIQFIDATEDWERALEKLVRALLEADVLPGPGYDRNKPGSVLYPGLRSFREDESTIFFGREAVIREVHDLIDQIGDSTAARSAEESRGGHAIGRFAVVTGVSGSGKSSVVRAGLIPRLRLAEDRWLIVGPFRPETHPKRAVTEAFAEAHERYGSPVDRDRIRRVLETPAGDGDGGVGALETLSRELVRDAGREGASVLLVVDQFEELLGRPRGRESDELLTRLKDSLRPEAGTLVALATLRSDRLEDFLVAMGRSPRLYWIPELGPSDFREIIEGPARLADLALEPGLVDAMIESTGGSDALPLLAYALNDMWRRYGREKGGSLELIHWREIGGLEGCIDRAAESAVDEYLEGLARESPDLVEPGDGGKYRLPDELDAELQDAFRHLARVDEHGHLVRRPARWSALPRAAHGLLSRLVDQYLLLPREERDDEDQVHQVVEASHDALFRAWRRLDRWMAAERGFLAWQRRLGAEIDQWNHSGRDEAALLRGKLLEEAEGWTGRLPEDGEERQFIVLSLEAKVRRERERARAEEEAARRRRAAVRLRWAGAALLLVAVLTGLVAFRADAERRHEERLNAANGVVSSIDLARSEGDPLAPTLLLAELSDRAGAPQPERGLTTALAVAETRVPWLHLGQDADIETARLSSDGSRLATGSADGSVRLWTIGDGRRRDPELLRDGHTARVREIDFRSDGTFVTASEDGTARLWSPAGEPKRVFTGHEAGLWSVEFSTDGSRVVTSSADGTARVFRVDGAGDPIVLRGHRGPVHDSRFDTRATRVVTASRDSTARVWTLADGSSTSRELRGHTGYVQTARFSHDGRSVVTASSDSTARIWSLETGASRTLEHDDAVWSAQFGRDDAWVVTASADGTARLWSTDGQERVVRLEGHEAGLVGAEFSPDGRYVLSSAEDGTARVWMAIGGRWESGTSLPVAILRHGRGDRRSTLVRVARFGSDGAAQGSRILTVGPDRSARIWRSDLTLLSPVTVAGQTYGAPGVAWERSPSLLGWHAEEVRALDVSPDGTRVASASIDGTVRIWATDGSGRGIELEGHGDIVLGVAFSRDGSRLVTASQDRTARVWTDPTGEWTDARRIEQVRLEHPAAVLSAIWDPSGDLILTGTKDAGAWLWRPADPEPRAISEGGGWIRPLASRGRDRILTWSYEEEDVYEHRLDPVTGWAPNRIGGHEGGVIAADLSPDGRWLVTASADGRVTLWDEKGTARTLPGHRSKVTDARFSSDGSAVVTASEDRTARVWPVAEGRRPVLLVGHSAPVNSASFDRDGVLVVTASDDGTVRIWTAETGKPFADIQTGAAKVVDARFDPRGRYVVGAASDGSVRLWTLDLSQIVRYARGATSACLSDEERRRYLAGDRVPAGGAEGPCGAPGPPEAQEGDL